MNMYERKAGQLPLKIYDCFTRTRFGGNVGGIVLEAGALDDAQMQAIALEINAPVTGFVTGLNERELRIRFFMPTAEIPMCGHVTVGLYTYLYEQGLAGDGGAQPPLMKTGAGDIRVSITSTPENGISVMMGLAPATIEECKIDRSIIAKALRIDEAEINPDLPVEIGFTGLRHLFVPISKLETFNKMDPDFPALSSLSNQVSVSTIAPFSLETMNPQNTLHCRDFCPAVGTDEVPGSGTTNSALAGYLVRNGLVEPADQDATLHVLAEQGSELGRPSIIQTGIVFNNGEFSQIRVGGNAVLSIDGFVNI